MTNILYIKTSIKTKYHRLNTDSDFEICTQAFLKGNETFTIRGITFYLRGLMEIKFLKTPLSGAEFDTEVRKQSYLNSGRRRLPTPNQLIDLGYLELSDITHELIGNSSFGQDKDIIFNNSSQPYVDPQRLAQLETVKLDNFDLSKFVKLCYEINHNYQYENFYSVGMLLRAAKDHIPPIFGFDNFKELVSQHKCPASVKGNLRKLQDSMKHISDRYLHETIKKKELHPTKSEIDFKPDFDVLLQEVIKLSKKY